METKSIFDGGCGGDDVGMKNSHTMSIVFKKMRLLRMSELYAVYGLAVKKQISLSISCVIAV